MNRKCGIITFHCVPNYGAVLQAYGLQQYLKSNFADVKIIDYRPQKIMQEYNFINFYSIFSVISSLWSLPSFWSKCKKFKMFVRKYLDTTSECFEKEDSFKNIDFDILVLGSDQIWNSQITHGFDNVYMGDLGCKSVSKIISYAASIGKSTLSEEEKNFFKSKLEKLDFISVRENEAKELLGPLTNKKIEVVADPTILAGKKCFEKLIKPKNIPKGKYVLLYSLNGYTETSAMAVKISKYFDAAILEISGRRKGIVKNKHKTLYSAAPEEFILLVANAEYVVTDSFHGTVFSILFHKQFVTIPHKTRNGRASNLLDICGLKSRMENVFSHFLVDEYVDWESVDQKLEKYRNVSEKFVIEALDLKE